MSGSYNPSFHPGALKRASDDELRATLSGLKDSDLDTEFARTLRDELIFRADPNYGNPFEPPETEEQRHRRIERMLFNRVDAGLVRFAGDVDREETARREPQGFVFRGGDC